MPTKKDYEDLIARVDERTKKIPLIEEHLRNQNDKIADVTKAEAVTRTIAVSAQKQSDKNGKYFTRLLLGMFLICLATILGFGIPQWLL